MGRDNHPHERQLRKLERKQNRRASYERVLIVSEGSKTEPQYFGEIRSAYRLHSANVAVQPSRLGTNCLQVVEYAAWLFENGDPQRGIQKRAFEKVYAVFDRDDHGTFHNAIARAKGLNGHLKNDLKQPIAFVAIPSRPSFEFWLLLHFEDVQHLLHRDKVVKRLKKHLPDYEKSAQGVYSLTKPKLTIAIERAKKLLNNDLTDDNEPYTGIVELVEALMNLKSAP